MGWNGMDGWVKRAELSGAEGETRQTHKQSTSKKREREREREREAEQSKAK